MRLRYSILLMAFACSPSTSSAPASPAKAPAASHDTPSTQPASRPASAAEQRATEAAARLKASEAGRHVLKATERHGSLRAWYTLGALRFGYRYVPQKGAVRDSVQTVDLLRSVAHHQLTEPVLAEMAWTGTEAWMRLADGKSFDPKKPPFAARFWALTPYYFVALPFVLSDAGVRLQMSTDDPTRAGFPEGTIVIRAGFETGTGDAPDDSYVIYLDPKDHRLLATRYTVTYAPFFVGSSVKETPEKLLIYSKPVTVGSVTLYQSQSFYAFKEQEKGAQVTEATVSKLAVVPDFVLPTQPEGASIDRSMD